MFSMPRLFILITAPFILLIGSSFAADPKTKADVPSPPPIPKTEQYIDAARQALQLANESAHYIGEARELFLKGIEELEGRKWYDSRDALKLLEGCLSRTGIAEGVEDRIFNYYAKLELFDDGIKYFDGRGDKTRTLKLIETAGLLGKARDYAKTHGMTEKVAEFDAKLGRKPTLKEKVEKEETFEDAIAHYTSAISEDGAKGHYDSAARTAKRAAEFCRAEHGDTECAEEFDEQL